MGHSYKINGEYVSKETALVHWLDSESYDSARVSTRSLIWTEAHEPDGGQYGASVWLAEAGIEIELTNPDE